MEKLFGTYSVTQGWYRDIAPIMETQMEKNMGNLGLYSGLTIGARMSVYA